MPTLVTFLRRSPQPHHIRVTTVNDEDLTIELSDASRNRWKTAAESVTSAQARVVFCLSKDDSVIRSMELEGEKEAEAREDSVARNLTKALATDRREIALILEAHGRQLNTAFDRGKEAAAASHEALENLVNDLTIHLVNAITNLHNASVNLANMMSATLPAGTEEKRGPNPMMMQMLAAAFGGGNPMAAAAAAAAQEPNGKKK
jgi:hypothetical protein